jgi:hypothetical protein
VSAPDRLDWTDPDAVRLWLTALRDAVGDAAGMAEDMLRAPRARDFGPRVHRRIYRDAAGSVAELLAFAGAGPEGERGDPAGLGDAGGG